MIRPAGRIAAALNRVVYRPGLRALVFLWGGSNFDWARRALLGGLALGTVGCVAGPGIVYNVLMALVWWLLMRRGWTALSRLERMVGTPTGALPRLVLHECRVLVAWRSASEVCALVFLVGAVLGMGWTVAIEAGGFALLGTASAWGTDFLPPGKGLRARVAEWAGSRAPAKTLIPAFS